jgi:citronellol/citronellal dehydrogenase
MYSKDLFKDKIVLITGGRSGIGYGIARHFQDLGAKIAICSRKEDKLEVAAKELSAFGTTIFQKCDIRNTEEIKGFADLIEKEYGRLDILINNAGGQFPALAEGISENGWNAVINSNLNGTFYMSKIMAEKFFIPQKQGNIINIIVNMHRGFPGMAHTGAARAGVENLTKSLAQEWSYYNIRVNAIAPGTIISSGLDTYIQPIKDLFEDIKEENLMKRLGTIEDVSNAVCFFASPLSAYTSGTTFYVDGMDHLHGNRMAMIQKLTGR